MTRIYGNSREWVCSLPSCGATFSRAPSQVRNPERVYCSPACAKRAKAEAALPPASRIRIAERYLSGEQTGDLAKEFGVNAATIRTALREQGVTPDRSRSGQASWARRVDVPPDEGDLESGFRWCGTCRERKPMSEFYWASGRDARRNAKSPNRLRECKSCRHAKRPDAAARRAARRKHTYGLTQEDFAGLVVDQDGCCAICRTRFEETGPRAIFVDHCHFDGSVRGLLCVRCNSGLGLFRDDPEVLQTAARYLLETDHWHPPLSCFSDD